MDSTSANELTEFYHFIGGQLGSGCTGMSPEECLDLWRVHRQGPRELAENVAAINAAIAESARGEGRPAGEVIAELRAELHLPCTPDDE
jgi:hypothetical protein